MGAVIALGPEDMAALESTRALVEKHGSERVRRALDILTGTATEDRTTQQDCNRGSDEIEPCPFK